MILQSHGDGEICGERRRDLDDGVVDRRAPSAGQFTSAKVFVCRGGGESGGWRVERGGFSSRVPEAD
jgi:hypothetical protein